MTKHMTCKRSKRSALAEVGGRYPIRQTHARRVVRSLGVQYNILCILAGKKLPETADRFRLRIF